MMCYAALLSSSACYLRRVHISNNLLKQDADSSSEGLKREMPVNREELLPHLLSVTNDSHLLTRKAVSSVLSRGRRKRWNDIFKTHPHSQEKTHKAWGGRRVPTKTPRVKCPWGRLADGSPVTLTQLQSLVLCPNQPVVLLQEELTLMRIENYLHTHHRCKPISHSNRRLD
jgi:hypothetical protein